MILGGISFLQSEQGDSIISRIRSFIDLEDIFHPVLEPGFTGGYYLNPRLPGSADDFYYHDSKNDIIVLFSGSVYNKSELAGLNYTEPQISDPELISKMFHVDGPGFINKLNGDFALLIFRSERRECYLFRDHVGIHPLCWIINKNTLYFSSEIMGLCSAFSERNNFDTDYILGYLKFIDNKKTANGDVLKLLPGHYLKYSGEGVELIKYWHPEKIKVDTSLRYDQMLSDLKAILYDSVKIRCDKRYIAGAHVSGGIDSCVVASLARKQYQQEDKFPGFSWSPENYSPLDVTYDERDLVTRFCAETNIDPVFSNLNSDNFHQLLSVFCHNHGFFSEDSTSEQVVKTNTNLIFSGWGGDEFISTGDRGIELDLLRGFKFKLFFKRNPLKRPLKLLRYLLSFVIFPAIGILDSETSESFKDEARYLKKAYKQSDRKSIADFYFHNSRRQMHLNMLNFYHLQDRCENWTIMGFRKGIEYRYPLLDKRIIEYMLKVPSELLCQTDYFRPILREIGKGILPEVVRLNQDKSDPVYWSWMDDLFKSTALELMQEAGTWKTNPDLHFVDFELLEKDMKKSRNNRLKINPNLFYRSMVFIKAINDFTIQYRGTKS